VQKQGVTELATQLDRLVKQYNPVALVMDAGGLGKKIVEELKRRYGLPVKAAEKSRKFEYIELLNDALRTGQFLAKSQGLFAQDTRLIEWDKAKNSNERLVISEAYHSDIADAVLYAFRESLHWVSHVVGQPTAPYGTPEWVEEQEREIIAALEKQLAEDDDDPISWNEQGFDDL
jgi:hypothetical protein